MTAELVRKLQLKEQRLRVVNAPSGFSAGALEAAPDDEDAAVLVFARNSAELDEHAAVAIEAARQDRLAWIAYPKAGQLGTDLNRDRLWERLKDQGIRGVRQVSIDAVWSAMRFRPEA